MANPRRVLAVPPSITSRRGLTEREILELAEMTSYVFDSREAVGLKARLKEEAKVYRDRLQAQQLLKDEAYQASLGTDEQRRRRVAYGIGRQRSYPGPESLTFLLAMLFTCPQLLSRPAGFEWVLQDLEKVLVERRLDPDSDRIFGKAMNKARIRSRVGPPKDKALDYFRYTTINELMHPSAVIPGVTAKLNKTQAVEFVAAMETGCLMEQAIHDPFGERTSESNSFCGNSASACKPRRLPFLRPQRITTANRESAPRKPQRGLYGQHARNV